MEKSIFSEILDKALKNSASDIHIGAGERPLMRVDGLLRAAGETPLSEDGFELMLEELGCSGSEKFKKERELDFGCEITVNGEKTRLRVNLSYSLGRPAAAIRIIPPRVRSIEELGLPPVLKELAAGRSGLFLVTGPSGSGKSTTLAAMIEEINASRAVHIVTVEDPVEYVFEPKRALIHQREAGRDTSGFAEALRRAMRQDPDVIMIGGRKRRRDGPSRPLDAALRRSGVRRGQNSGILPAVRPAADTRAARADSDRRHVAAPRAPFWGRTRRSSGASDRYERRQKLHTRGQKRAAGGHNALRRAARHDHAGAEPRAAMPGRRGRF